MKLIVKGIGKIVNMGGINGEVSDLEREVIDSEVGGSFKGERKNRFFKKSFKKDRI